MAKVARKGLMSEDLLIWYQSVLRPDSLSAILSAAECVFWVSVASMTSERISLVLQA